MHKFNQLAMPGLGGVQRHLRDAGRAEPGCVLPAAQRAPGIMRCMMPGRIDTRHDLSAIDDIYVLVFSSARYRRRGPVRSIFS